MRSLRMFGFSMLLPALALAQQPGPVIDVRFENATSLPAGARFQRPSSATRIGADGRIQTVDPNVPRFASRKDANGVSMTGYLSEGPATNLLLHSSFESSLDAVRAVWREHGEVTTALRDTDGIHGRVALQLDGQGDWLHAPRKLGSFAAPEFRGYFLTAYVRTPDGKPPQDDSIQVVATRKPGGENAIPASRRFQDALRVGPWWRIGGYVAPEFEGQDWLCGVRVNGQVLLDAVQLERRPLHGCEAPTSYIPTTTEPARRAGDDLSLAPHTLKWPGNEGTLVVWVRTGSPVHNGSAPIIRQEYQLGQKSHSLAVMHHGGALDVSLPIGGGNTPRPVLPDHWTQVAFAWRGGRGWAFVDGQQNDRGGLAGQPVLAEFGTAKTRLSIGVQLGNYAQLAGYVSRIQLFNTAWDHDVAWDQFVASTAAAGGYTVELIRPAKPKPPKTRPMIDKRHWVRFSVDLPLKAATSAVVYDATGRLVRTLWESRPAQAGPVEVVWDTGDDAGQRMPPGRYELRVLQVPSVSARYVATPGNGRVPQRKAADEIAGVHGLTPRGVCVDAQGDLYLLARGHGVGAQKYAADGRLIWTHAPLDSADVPTACAVDGTTVFVAGRHLYRIDARTGNTIREPDGRWRVYLGDTPSTPDSPRVRAELADVRETVIEGQVLGQTSVRGVAVQGRSVYVSCWAQNLIRVYDRETLEPAGTLPLAKPAGLAFDRQQRLLAISGRDLVRHEQDAWRVIVSRVARSPYGLTVSDNNHTFVTDLGDPCRLLEYGSDGRLVSSYGRPGPLPGPIQTDRLYAPTGVACGPGGAVYVSEYLLNRLLKLGPDRRPQWALYGGAYMENASLLSDDPTVVYGLDGYDVGALYEYKLDLDSGQWSPRRWWWLGHKHPTRHVRGFMIHGQQTHTIDGRRYLFTCHKTVRIYRFDGDRLVSVARVGGRFRYYDADGELQTPSGAFPIWVDRNGDELAQENEIEFAPQGQFATEPHIGFSHDMEVTRDGTVYWGNFALPLQKIDQRGVPHYTWKTASVAGPDFKPLVNEMLEGVGADAEGNRYFDIFYKDDSLRQPGVGHWARRVIRCDISRYDRAGRRIWSVGHKAIGKPEPGGIHQPTCTRVEGEWVFVADEVGLVHIWSRDGLYVASLLKNIYVDNRRQQARQRGYLRPYEVTIGEFWSLDVVQQPQTGRFFVVGQSHEFGEHVRVYEVTGLQDIKRVQSHVTIGDTQ